MGLRHRFAGLNYLEAAKFVVNYKDVFSMKYVYSLIREWLIEEGYATRDDEKFPEVYYLQKEHPVVGKDLWIRWRLTKNPLPHKTESSMFWKFMLDIDMHILGMTDVEVLVKDKKLKVNKGEIEFQVLANLVWDASRSWEKSTWLKPFKNIYFKRFMREQREELKDKLYEDAYRLQGAIKTYLKLESYLPEKEGEAFWKRVQE